MRPPTPLLTVSCPPHLHCGRTTTKLMLEILLALLPAMILAIIHFGVPALRVMALTCFTAVITDALCTKLMERDIDVDNFHGLLTGLLIAFLLPASAPWWLAVLAGVITIVAGKALFGGLGASPLSAPCVGWAILVLSWPEAMDPELSMLGTSFAAPLHDLKHFGLGAVEDFNLIDFMLGKQLGGLGAVQIVALLAGGIWLKLRRRIKPLIPLGFLVGLVFTAACFSVPYPDEYANPLFHLATGSTIFACFFLATDNSSSPVNRIPMFLFGLIAGSLVIIVRSWGIYPDGAPFAVLLANLVGPLLDRIRPTPFGAVKEAS